MTEEEAAQRWCPQVRIIALPAGDFDWNRPGHVGPCTCMGSKCMAWRWVWPQVKTIDGEIVDPGSGYCGLAGKP